MNQTRHLHGYVITSKRRHQVLKALATTPLRTTELAHSINHDPASVSRLLFQLEKHALVECLTPDKKTWRLYAITERGKEVLKLDKAAS